MLAARLIEPDTLPPKPPEALVEPEINDRWAFLQELADENEDVRLQFESEYALSKEADFIARMEAHGDYLDRELDSIITSKDALEQAAAIDLDELVAQIDF